MTRTDSEANLRHRLRGAVTLGLVLVNGFGYTTCQIRQCK